MEGDDFPQYALNSPNYCCERGTYTLSFRADTSLFQEHCRNIVPGMRLMKFKSTLFSFLILGCGILIFHSCEKKDTTFGDPTAITFLNCSATNFSAPAFVDSIYSGVAFVPYMGGNGGADTAMKTIISSGVYGLVATHILDTLAVGAGTLKYRITGKPTSKGNATFPIDVGGQRCSFTLTVN